MRVKFFHDKNGLIYEVKDEEPKLEEPPCITRKITDSEN